MSMSCTQKYSHQNQFVYHDDGKIKPKIALIPVIDHSCSNIPWSLSEELSQDIENQLFKSNLFYLTSDYEMLNKNQISKLNINLFSDDINWIKESNSPTEFIIFIELIDHKLIPKSTEGKLFYFKAMQPCNLDMSIRIKVLDIRSATPKVILQEILHQSFNITWKFLPNNYNYNNLSKQLFRFSSIGLAHRKMTKKITKQIQDYILLSKSN